MPKINILEKSVAELIAAGEVIERPASIVKELLENAVDAGSTALTVEIKRGGTSFIRITDNGCGIARDDVSRAFLRHATSKVQKKEDLTGILTLGFRGEALASICAVSKVEMITRTCEEAVGTRVLVQGGEICAEEDAGCPQGTTMVVRDLFYNVPARLKFLKKDVTEGNAIQGIVEKLALSHPEISFRFLRDNKSVMHTPGDGKLISTVYAVFGRDFAGGLLPVSYVHQGIRVEGFVTKPSHARGNRTMQHFFINERYVKSRTCMAALEEGFKHSLMVQKFPGCVLLIYLDAALVDVNVHPAKIEVRFVNERPVFEAVYFAVKSALDQQDSLRNQERVHGEIKQQKPELLSSFRNSQSVQTKIPVSLSGDNGIDSHSRGSVTRINAQEYQRMMSAPVTKLSEPSPKFNVPLPQSDIPLPEEPPDYSNPVPQLKEEEFSYLAASSFQKQPPEERQPEKRPLPDARPENEGDTAQEEVTLRYIGELFKTYVLFEAEERFVLIDKHAAHERILYDSMRTKLSLKDSQLLLVPVTLTVSAAQAEILGEHIERFEESGFRVAFSGNCLEVLEAPLVLHRYDLKGMVEELIDNIAQSKIDVTPHLFDDLLHSMACRAAIKANETNTPEELEALARRVYFDSSIRHCPHGRPVGITMTRFEIEKQFGRQN